ncbi:DeoR/GlpR family DNA-binding transcription regulator [Sporohalobacter salinus]|uniref:DeoR/GlpR family DNA-binding transcription regulator n=1 Tax=Sporohalobacter salinus TaxID=1494606 RepID=UPI00195FFDC8|nr:DeoR/GlpR family DNA-binding transcription regulator [Sporohalobacter salinus]MBM7624168.1 DeoR family fructose operon transcriptional repressor [Sporohalobacter salinus]
MFAEERQKKILELIKQRDSVKVNQLSEKFSVSPSTIRRDLKELEQENLIKRTHGGAVNNESMKFEPSVSEKEEQRLKEKEWIGSAAANLVVDGESIILDAGTTTAQIAKNLTEGSDLTVITNGINVAAELEKIEGIEILVAGGRLKQKTLSLIGSIAQQMLKKIKVDKAFIGVNGITVEDGLTTPDIEEAKTKEIMIETAKEVIVVADHSKFGQVTFAQICSLEKIDKIITDKTIDDEILDEYLQLGIDVDII